MADRKQLLKSQATRQALSAEQAAEALALRLKAFLDRNLRRILEALASNDPTAREAAKALGGLESALRDAGLAGELGRLRAVFAQEFDQISALVTQSTGQDAEGPLSGFVRQNLKVLEDDQLTLAARFVTQYLGDVRSVVLDSLLAGKTVQPSKVLAAAEGRTISNLETEVRTGLMGYQRLVAVEKAKALGITKYLYVGPDDKVTREFCHARVDRVFTLEQIQAMDNGQGLPVVVYGGGYNCRHHWRPVSDELAEELSGNK